MCASARAADGVGDCAIVACLGPDTSLSDIRLVKLSEFPQALLNAAQQACRADQETPVPRARPEGPESASRD